MSTTSGVQVPFVNLTIQHREIADEVAAGIEEVIAGTAFVLGPHVERFEREFAQYSGVAHCVGVANGTDAVELALRAIGIETGDEVILPANTFVATAEAAVRAGAKLVYADVTADYLIDPNSVSEHVTSKTRAVVGVHLYGQMAPMGALRSVLTDEVVLVEDAAQSQGASQHGRLSGSIGLVAGTSFYPGKNLGAYGDAGAVLTADPEIDEFVRATRNHGGVKRYEHSRFGFNSRLDGIQAVILSAKLRRLGRWNEERRLAALIYDELLEDVEEVVRPAVAPGNQHVWHLYVVAVDRRDEVVASLTAAGIGAGIHYPTPVHLLPPFQRAEQGRGSLPMSERLSERILSLPMFPGISQAQQERVVYELVHAVRTGTDVR